MLLNGVITASEMINYAFSKLENGRKLIKTVSEKISPDVLVDILLLLRVESLPSYHFFASIVAELSKQQMISPERAGEL